MSYQQRGGSKGRVQGCAPPPPSQFNPVYYPQQFMSTKVVNSESYDARVREHDFVAFVTFEKDLEQDSHTEQKYFLSVIVAFFLFISLSLNQFSVRIFFRILHFLVSIPFCLHFCSILGHFEATLQSSCFNLPSSWLSFIVFLAVLVTKRL